MTSLDRLSPAALDAHRVHGLPDQVRPPAPLDRSAPPGIVHLGIGAFHRAHQAVVTERAGAAHNDSRWGIVGVTQRSASVRDQLAPQGGLYGVLELSQEPDGTPRTALDLIGSVRDVLFPGEDTAKVMEAIAATPTRIVSLTVTEKGYRRHPQGGPDFADPALGHDLDLLARELGGKRDALATPSRSAIGTLLRGLAHRWATSGAPLTVVVCDNLLDNGPQVAQLVHRIVDSSPAKSAEAFGSWLRESVAFPASMVDRIVPATTDAHRATAEHLLGLRDAGLVVAEPFLQWVIEDRFAGPRPAWEDGGATLTDNVTPYEHTKLRVLNGTHSFLAYAGALRGHALIADAVADPELNALARELIDSDAIPSLEKVDEIDVEGYRESVLERFANGAIGHTTVQIAMDGSQKLPIRFLGTAADRLAAGAVPHAIARAVAAWMLYVYTTTQDSLEVGGTRVELDDPLATPLADAARGPLDSLADRLLAMDAIFPAHLAEDPRWRDAVRAGLREVSSWSEAPAMGALR
ncbi:mannitol dehydrogenase family protein [Demequina globuliformis]|uniref:mannitol dehydrogenase family protein n=1 Tax=Demequina globuliformis TaxID=676202 RepID=UPI00078583D2|nr:mannitol dehydrogenase family protein [Demequina globuliformis]